MTDDIVDFLSNLEVLSALPREALGALSARLEEYTYEFGDTICEAGSEADGLYVVHSGGVRLFTSRENGKERSAGVRKEGQTFAELAAIREYRHEFSVRASANTVLWMLPTSALRAVLASNPDAQSFVNKHIAITSAGGLVSQLFDLRRKVGAKELEEIVASVGVKQFSAGDVIFREGDTEEQRLHVVRAGSVAVSRTDKAVEHHLATLSNGDVFGQASALEGGPQTYSTTAETGVVVLVVPSATVRKIVKLNPALRSTLDAGAKKLDREFDRQRQVRAMRRRPAMFDLVQRSGWGQRVLRMFPLVEQAEEMDCGAACLAMVSRHYKLKVTLGKLREMANVTTEGATLDSLARAGESLGFSARALRCDFDTLSALQLPVIVHWEGYHYVVVYGVSARHVYVADPARGFVKMPREEFELGWTAGVTLLLEPGVDMAGSAQSKSPWARFINYLTPYKKLLGYLIGATLVIETLGIAPPLIVQNVLDNVIVHQSTSLLHILVVGLVLSHLFTQITTAMRGLLSNFLVRKLDFAMMSHFLKHTLSLPLSFFSKRRTGDIFARFQENDTIRGFLTESTISTLLNLLMTVLYIAVLFVYSATLTGLLLLMIIPIALLTLAVTPKIKQYARRSFEASTEAEGVLMEAISSAETIKAMGVERAVRRKWEEKYAAALNVQYDAGAFEIGFGVVSQLLSAAISVVVLLVGANLVIEQQLTTGQLIAFNMLVGSVMAPIMGLIGVWDEFHETAVSMERLGDVLDIAPEQREEDLSARIVLPEINGDLHIANLFFRYGGNETPYVLQDVSFDVKAGETVAIVGLSGSGKTTLAKLLVGFYPPTEGNIHVDGYALNQIDLEYYRGRVGYVMQNNLLFSGTIAENIAMGVENPDRRRIAEAAELADAHGFVSALPLGYDQVVGERGVGLSGGQIQRLCIARALYRDPQVLILDEATSALDAQAEVNILDNMKRVTEGRTCIVIAHRLSTVRDADKILVLYEGGIAESGKHDELVARQGMYYQLFKRQMAAE